MWEVNHEEGWALKNWCFQIKAAKISEEETLLGLGWLFKEGKLAAADEKITLA